MAWAMSIRGELTTLVNRITSNMLTIRTSACQCRSRSSLTASSMMIRSEGLTPQQAKHITQTDSNLHQQGSYNDEDWTLDAQMPGSQIDEGHGPDWNFIHSSNDEDPVEYAVALKQWLDGIQPQDPAPAPTPHHETIADIAPGAPQQPAYAPPYWPAGHVPDWADPTAEGVTASRPKPEPDPEEETTTGGWLHDESERLIEREISPQEYDEALDEHVAQALKPKRGRWLSRLLRRG
jgi:hypothetical protein